MTRTPYQLAALASAAVAGLDPVAAGPFPAVPGAGIEIASVADGQGRSWIVRAASSSASAAALDASAAVAALVGRRLGVSVPTSRGHVTLPDGGRVHVHAAIPGRGLKFAALEPPFPIVTTLGRLIASVHNLEPGLFEGAGLESYTGDEYRRRRLADLDRAAATGRVPADLLTRWEGALENVALWQFVPVPVHGGLEGRHVLVTLADDGEVSIRGVVGWRNAKVADPADDFAALVREAPPRAVVEVARTYARTRSIRPDRHLLTRAKLVAELGYVRDLFDALAAGYPEATSEATSALRTLASQVADTELVPRTPSRPTPAPDRDAPPPEHGSPEPETPEPQTPEPGTPAPQTPAPQTPEPGTPEPETPEPEAPEPGSAGAGSSNR